MNGLAGVPELDPGECGELRLRSSGASSLQSTASSLIVKSSTRPPMFSTSVSASTWLCCSRLLAAAACARIACRSSGWRDQLRTGKLVMVKDSNHPGLPRLRLISSVATRSASVAGCSVLGGTAVICGGCCTCGGCCDADFFGRGPRRVP